MKAYIDRHRDDYGVEPICRVLQMAPSCYWRHAARQRNPQLRSQRAQRDEGLKADIQRVWHANWQVYGALLHKPNLRRHAPNPRRIYPTATVTGRPSWLKRLSSAARMCSSTT